MEPLFVETKGHRTWIKWHRARRRAADPVFTGARILEGMRLGASVEVDLVVHGSHGCAVLHNLDLDEETTGTGPVRAASDAVLRGLFLRGNGGEVLPDRVMLLEDLCALLHRNPPRGEALLQLDFKEDLAALDAETVARFAASVGPVADHMILSGGDAPAISRLVAATPGLRHGYDPCHGDTLAKLLTTRDFAGFITTALRTAPEAAMIYLDHNIVAAADAAGFNLIAACHADGRRVDCWTIQRIAPESIARTRRLIALGADQITTDDPEGMMKALST